MAGYRDDLTGVHLSSETSSSVVVPDHELVRLIGQGSYGEVWLSRSALGTYRAVKIVFEKTFRHKRPFEREFNGVRKFEPISRLHEGLMDVLQVGRNDAGGYFYCVMELADDIVTGQAIDPDHYFPRTLAHELARRKRLPVEECRRIGTAIASALDFLHGHNLIHRDVKPSNIVFVNGIPKLADIGLVVEMSEARSYVGTEGFIPPEGPGTPQADIYSLGKVLYEISTGKDRHDYPELPTLQGEASEDAEILEFNQVVLRTCRSDPRERCQSAREMLDDLAALQNGGSPRRRFSAGRKWVHRLVPAVLLVVLCLAGMFWSQENKQRPPLKRVVPNYLETNEVPYGSSTFKLAGHYQFVYGAEEFPPEPILISELRFRPAASWGHAFSTTVSNLEVRLSTTSKKYDQLSAAFAENTGGNEVLAFKGTLSISSRFAGPVGGPKAFDVVVPLQTPFLYDRDAGNLLVDILNSSGSDSALLAGVEPFATGAGKDRASRAVATNAFSAVASYVNSGVDALQIGYQTAKVRVASWPAEGSAQDQEGGNHGTIREVTFAPGKIGQAFRFGTNYSLVRVPCNPALQFTGPFAVTAWAKYDRITGEYGNTIVTKGPDDAEAGDWQLAVSSVQRLRPHVNLNGDWHWFDCKTTLKPGTWYHVAMTFDGVRLKGFVNGIVDGEQGAAGTVRTSEDPVKIGCGAPRAPLETASCFAGEIDEVTIYKGTFTEDEIRALYEKDLAAKPVRSGGTAVR